MGIWTNRHRLMDRCSSRMRRYVLTRWESCQAHICELGLLICYTWILLLLLLAILHFPTLQCHPCPNSYETTNTPSKWFVTQLGPDNLYKMLTGFSDHTATSVCTFGYTAGPGQDVLIFQGRTSGRIVPARGPRDFGWDSAFEYDGRTYAEMPKEEKNKISHRGKALAKLRAWLEGGEVDK